MYINNPKALNLDGLKNQTNKVTLGFRCTPQKKISLATQAANEGLTLSEFTENIVNTYDNNKKTSEDEMEALQKKIDFYENRTLLNLYQKYKGQVIKFTSVAGDYMEVAINQPKDIYTVLINSFNEKQ